MPWRRPIWATCTRTVRGVVKAESARASWYAKSSAQGNAVAQAALGWMYMQGRGVSRDDAQAVEWSNQKEMSPSGGLPAPFGPGNDMGVRVLPGRPRQRSGS